MKASVEISHLDDELLLISDCSNSALTISSSYHSALQALFNTDSEQQDLIKDSIVVSSFPDIAIDGQYKNYSEFLLPDKNVSQNNQELANSRLRYFWQASAFEWFQAYRSNQSPLSPRPYLALMRIANQTWASASAVLSKPQHLKDLLAEDFIQQRSPLMLFISSQQALSAFELKLIKAQNFKIHQSGRQLIATKDIPVCDSGSLSPQSPNPLLWIKVELQQ